MIQHNTHHPLSVLFPETSSERVVGRTGRRVVPCLRYDRTQRPRHAKTIHCETTVSHVHPYYSTRHSHPVSSQPTSTLRPHNPTLTPSTYTHPTTSCLFWRLEDWCVRSANDKDRSTVHWYLENEDLTVECFKSLLVSLHDSQGQGSATRHSDTYCLNDYIFWRRISSRNLVWAKALRNMRARQSRDTFRTASISRTGTNNTTETDNSERMTIDVCFQKRSDVFQIQDLSICDCISCCRCVCRDRVYIIFFLVQLRSTVQECRRLSSHWNFSSFLSLGGHKGCLDLQWIRSAVRMFWCVLELSTAALWRGELQDVSCHARLTVKHERQFKYASK